MSKIYARVEEIKEEHVQTELMKDLRNEVNETIRVIGDRIKDLRESVVSLNRGIEKLNKLGNIEDKQRTKS